jgi:hypothetical protein
LPIFLVEKENDVWLLISTRSISPHLVLCPLRAYSVTFW